jgi:putative phosphoribosyl transferase
MLMLKGGPGPFGVKAMIFKNREDAGRQLAKHLQAYANREDSLVLGIPRGGVAVAFYVAQALRLPLDIFLSRKLGVPGQEELAFGAIAAGDGRFVDQQVIRYAGITPQEIDRISREAQETLRQRDSLYRGNRPPLEVQGHTVILVDDGVATGASIYAAINALRQMRPEKLVVAVPVGPASTCAWLKTVVDQLVCLHAPEEFHAVGQFYRSFSEVPDEEVKDFLRRSEESLLLAPATTWEGGRHDLSIGLDNTRVEATLGFPEGAKGIVLFAHGSGSSRHSPRNQYVAQVLQSQGIATLLFDLLSQEEELLDRETAELRFDIGLLADRLTAVTRWVIRHPAIGTRPIGYFGASTGAAAALVAAAQLSGLIAAVVSRGGRPDLAGEALNMVRAPVLFIVGENDPMVLSLNRQAEAGLKCPGHRLVTIPGATHLFEEPGALEQVARVAAEWFAQCFVSAGWKTASAKVSGAN